MAATNQPESSRRISFNKSIDTVLGDAAEDETKTKKPATSRPTPSTRPSWIGPPRSDRHLAQSGSNVPQKIEIAFTSPGLKPPVYIFTNLSEPAWEEIEMAYECDSKGKYHFKKIFEADEGMYQYKFRLGSGDWWVCDNSKAIIFDKDGNENNLVCVSALLNFSGVINQAKILEPSNLAIDSNSSSNDGRGGSNYPSISSLEAKVKDSVVIDSASKSVTTESDDGEGADHKKSATVENRNDIDFVDHDEKTKNELSASDSNSSQENDRFHPGITTDGKTYWDEYGVPLLPHEVRLYFPHADMSHHPWDLGRQGQASPSTFPLVPEEADPNDLRHERFPTTRQGILALIRDLAVRQTILDAQSNSDLFTHTSAISQQTSDQTAIAPLTSVVEDEEDDGDEELFENTRESNMTNSDLEDSSTGEENSVTDADAEERQLGGISQAGEQAEHEGDAIDEGRDSNRLSSLNEIVAMFGDPAFAFPTAIAVLALATAIATYTLD